MSVIDFEPTDVKDLTMPERTVIEGANVIDYDVEYGTLPVNPEQLAAPTYNVGVPAEGTLGFYETDGTGDAEQYEVDSVTLKAGGKGYVENAVAKIRGISPSDVLAEVTIKSVEPTVYSVASAAATVETGETMTGYAKDETITIAGASGDTSAVLTIASVTAPVYNIASATASGDAMTGYNTNEVITIPGASGDTAAVLTITAEEGVITGLTVTTAGEFASSISGVLTSDDYSYGGEGIGATITVVGGVADAGGSITGLTVTTAGEFASNIAGTVDPAKITYSGSGQNAVIVVTTDTNADAGEILSIELKSKGVYAKELDGDVDIIAGSGTGGKVTVDMEKIDPSAE